MCEWCANPASIRSSTRAVGAGALQVPTRRRDIRVAQEVPYIVQVRPRFEQGAGELPPQVMEVQIDTAEDPLDSRDNFPSAIQSGV